MSFISNLCPVPECTTDTMASSPSSIVSDTTEMIDMGRSTKRRKMSKDGIDNPPPVTPKSVNDTKGGTKMFDDNILSDLMKDENVGDFLTDIDTLEDDCYSYIGSVIGNSDLMINLMLLYRGHTGFIIVSKKTKETWVSGTIEKDGFSLEFHRPLKKDKKRLNGKYLELRDILLEEANYRLNEFLNN